MKILILEMSLQKSNYIFLFRTFQNGYIMYSENAAHFIRIPYMALAYSAVPNKQIEAPNKQIADHFLV